MDEHYGNGIIDALKQEGMYGDWFSYEEYQELKACVTREEFAIFIERTKFRGTPVYVRAADTHADLRLQSLIKEVSFNGWDATHMGCNFILFPLSLPLYVIMYIRDYGERKRLRLELSDFRRQHHAEI